MHPKTEEFLYHLLWTADQLMRPGFRSVTDSFESWAYRNGFMRQLAALEREKFLDRRGGSRKDRLYRLSAQGRVHVLGGRDPMERWARSWDGKWRVVLFDVPTKHNVQREQLRRYLRGKGFGCLQHSVWITPDPLDEERGIFGGASIDVESLVVMEARPCAGESDAQIVAGGWDFERINRRYDQYLKILATRPDGALVGEGAAKALLRWGRAEREAWMAGFTIDPLLPSCLLPAGYLGQKAWKERVKGLGKAGRQLRTFRLG